MNIEFELASPMAGDVTRLLDAVPSSTVLMDLDARIRCWNDAAVRLTGFTSDEAVGKPLAELLKIRDEDKARLEQIAELATRERHGNATCRLQCVGHHKHGRQLTLAIAITPIELGGETLLGGFIADLADRHDLEAQVLHAQRMEIASRLAAGIAHDFNNLLFVVLGNSEVLLEQLPEDDRRRALVREVLDAGRRGAALARQLLTFSRAPEGEVRIVDTNTLLSEMEGLLRRLVGEDVRLVMALRASTSRVRSDPSHLEQLVMNLVINARDALPSGGTILVETALQDVVAGNSDGLAPGSYVTIAVRDDGVGMDEATQRRIFDPYFTTKGAHGGSGLGLATCRTIAERYGGRITVASRPGQGSRFVVKLPATLAPAEGTVAASPPRPSKRGVETILVVEDDDGVRNLLCRVLGAQGYSVVGTWSAAAALEYVERSPNSVHLMLTDLVLPGLGGPQLCEQMAAINPSLPILVMSGYGPDAWLRYGVADESKIVQKPFDVMSLLLRVRALLDAR